MFITKKRYNELKEELEREKVRRMTLQATIAAWHDQAILARLTNDKETREMAYKLLIADIMSGHDEL